MMQMMERCGIPGDCQDTAAVLVLARPGRDMIADPRLAQWQAYFRCLAHASETSGVIRHSDPGAAVLVFATQGELVPGEYAALIHTAYPEVPND